MSLFHRYVAIGTDYPFMGQAVFRPFRRCAFAVGSYLRFHAATNVNIRTICGYYGFTVRKTNYEILSFVELTVTLSCQISSVFFRKERTLFFLVSIVFITTAKPISQHVVYRHESHVLCRLLSWSHGRICHHSFIHVATEILIGYITDRLFNAIRLP